MTTIPGGVTPNRIGSTLRTEQSTSVESLESKFVERFGKERFVLIKAVVAGYEGNLEKVLENLNALNDRELEALRCEEPKDRNENPRYMAFCMLLGRDAVTVHQNFQPGDYIAMILSNDSAYPPKENLFNLFECINYHEGNYPAAITSLFNDVVVTYQDIEAVETPSFFRFPQWKNELLCLEAAKKK